MLISLIALAVFLTNTVQALIATAGGQDASAVGPPLRPEDPTTMTLALIGAGTVAVYFTVRRPARKPSVMTGADSLSRPPLADAADNSSRILDVQPSRGAA